MKLFEMFCAAFLILVLTGCLNDSSELKPIEDNVNLEFVNDSVVIGEWSSVDYVKTIELYDPSKKSEIWDKKSVEYLSGLVFEKNGRLVLKMHKTDGLENALFKWTKGVVIRERQKIASKYIIKDINGVELMFFEWKSGDYIERHRTPQFYVLKRVN